MGEPEIFVTERGQSQRATGCFIPFIRRATKIGQSRETESDWWFPLGTGSCGLEGGEEVQDFFWK